MANSKCEGEARAVRRLDADAVGPWGLAALVIGVTSPAIGLYACWGPIEAAAGPIAPLVFLAALAITLPTVISYASLNRHAPSAGAAAAWLWTTVNPTTGLLAGLVTISYFTMGALTTPLLFGLFLRDLMGWAAAPVRGLAPVAVGIVLQSAIVAWISVRGARRSVGTTIGLMLAETGVVLALSATILWVKAGQPGGVDLSPLDPAQAAHGAGGFWAAVLLGMLAFTGFDAVAATVEEARAPREHAPRVLILGVIGIALFWAANAWVLTLSTSPSKVAEYNARGLTAITSVARTYWGGGELIVIATGFTGLTAIYLGCVQGASRVLFALARHGLAPAPFARLEGEHRTPRAAVLAVVGACTALALVSLAVLGDGLEAFVWWSNAVVFFAALTFIGVNVANLIYFRRVAPALFSPWLNLVSPIVGVALSLYLIYAAFFSALWSQPFRTGKSVVIGCLGLFALQILVTAGTRLLRRDLFTTGAPIGVEAGAG